MEKKKKIIIGVVIALIVIAIAVAGIVLFLNANNPKNSVQNLMNALVKGDVSKISEYVDDSSQLVSADLFKEDSSEDNTQMTDKEKLLYSSLEYKINNVTENGDVATVEVEVTNKNFKTIVSNYMQKVVKVAISGQSPSDEEIENYLVEELKNESIDKVTTTQNISVQRIDGKWKVKVDDNLQNALFPGLQDVLSVLNSEFNID